jgi:hypothetical protein
VRGEGDLFFCARLGPALKHGRPMNRPACGAARTESRPPKFELRIKSEANRGLARERLIGTEQPGLAREQLMAARRVGFEVG